MTSLSLHLLIFFISLACAALFAYLETAFTALRLFEVNQLESRIGRYKSLFATWRATPQRLLITMLIASNFADVLCSVLITEVMQKLFGGELGLAIGVFCATLLILFFGNILPKSFAKTGAKGLSHTMLGFVSVMVTVLSPFVTVAVTLANLFDRSGIKEGESHPVTEKEIEFLIDYSDQKGLMESDKSEMLQNVFGLGQITVEAIMVPREDMLCMEVNTSVAEAFELFSKHRFSRIPVYENKQDNIVGFIYQKDLFGLMHKTQEGTLRDLMRPVVFIPEIKKVNQVLREFLKTRRHLAIIIDEYGAVVGMVTLEDVLEEIVGEIRDEHEEGESHIMPLENGQFVMDGKAEIKKVEEALSINMSSSSAVTLGGFLAEKLEHVPRKGERFVYKGFVFEVQQASLRKVNQVLVLRDDG
ncbi:MAG: hemolysin family protein [Candidatus Dependentiae bacterium]|jgi:CBS domain containing-hemolysin-like protein